ncbi:MAG: undecaprenyl-diphosphate phosphatase [Candidatus Brocadiia bacterium]
MSIIESIVLAIIQGVTEFLPVSSSGHLVIATKLFGMSNPDTNLSLIVFLHVFSLLAIIISFYKEIFELLTQPKVILMIIIATIPAGLIGYLFEDYIQKLFEGTVLTGAALMVTGIYIILTELHWKRTEVNLEQAPLISALWVGIAQAFAIIPGLSRSGLTICTGLLNGYEKHESIKFSFFLALPVLAGATVLKLRDFSQLKASFQPITILISGVICLLVSLLAIHLLIRLIRRRKLIYFGWYCLIAGILTVIFIR